MALRNLVGDLNLEETQQSILNKLPDQKQLYESVEKTAKSSLIRQTITPDTEQVLGRVQGYNVRDKFGRNPFVTTSASLSSPQDIWNGGTQYTGFPTGDVVDNVRIYSDNNDDQGFLLIFGLKTPTSISYESEIISLTGTTPTISVNGWWRVNTAQFYHNNTNLFNAGTITIEHQNTPANVFAKIPIGFSRTQMLCFTVPYKNTCLIKSWEVDVSLKNTGTVDFVLWERGYNESPNRKFPGVIKEDSPFTLQSNTGLKIKERTDFSVQIVGSNAGTLQSPITVEGYWNLHLVQDLDA